MSDCYAIGITGAGLAKPPSGHHPGARGLRKPATRRRKDELIALGPDPTRLERHTNRTPRARRAPVDRGNTVATPASPYASDASAKARYSDDLDAPASILRACTRLRALWAVWPVVVRVHSSAFVVEIATIRLQCGIF